MYILIVEDELNLRKTLEEYLQEQGFFVIGVETLEEARYELNYRRFDLVLLDVGLPDGCGFDFPREWLEKNKTTQFLFITAWSDPEYRIKGLELGAADYIVKPFHLKEISLRLKRILGWNASSTQAKSSWLQVGSRSLDFTDPRSVKVLFDGVTHELSMRESQVLRYLVNHQGRVVGRDELLQEVHTQSSPDESGWNPRSIDNIIVKLRKVLGDAPENPRFLKSIRGVGYEFVKQSDQLLIKAIEKKNPGVPPVWMMRQAGRYHKHYQSLRAQYSFMDLCKIPKVASEVTRGPVEDFDFDAAILFSDLLFPLEAMGMGLEYSPGPKLKIQISSTSDLVQLPKFVKAHDSDPSFFKFQTEALHLIRGWLPSAKSLLGFVGGPWTLFAYASKMDGLDSTQSFALFEMFEKMLRTFLEHSILAQVSLVDVMAFFDTSVAEIQEPQLKIKYISILSHYIQYARTLSPKIKILYYSKHTGPSYWNLLENIGIDVLGVDHEYPMTQVLKEFGTQFALQGNVDPLWLTYEEPRFEMLMKNYLAEMKSVPRQGWICALGHGVTPQARESNVRKFIEMVRHELS